MHTHQIVSPFRDADHHHADCMDTALGKAEDSCLRRGLRLTAIRRRVLELVWTKHEPVKAYDLLEALKQEKKGAAPPTVYRALEFLQQQGFVHRIESLNAYVGCGEPGHQTTAQFLICHVCGVVAELEDREIGNLIASKAHQLGFTSKHQTIEVHGLCTTCGSD
jgi:Fur family transcriptional regulator, zinc uptake regulator